MTCIKDIVGYESEYQIADDGRVYSLRTKRWLKPNTDKDGYLYYTFSVDGKRRTVKAHKLVADAFIPNTEGKPTVDHINGIKSDNRVENLRWATYSEQKRNPITHRAIVARMTPDYMRRLGSIRNYGRKLIKAIDINDCSEHTFNSLSECCKVLGFSESKGSEAANGKRAKVGHYVLRYL